MTTSSLCLGIALMLTAVGAAAKEAAPNNVNKRYLDAVKREQRPAAPDSSNPSDGWQPYLRWHRDATSMQGSYDRGDPGRVGPYMQL